MLQVHLRFCWARKSKVRYPLLNLNTLITPELVSRDMDTEVRKVPLGVTAAYV